MIRLLMTFVVFFIWVAVMAAVLLKIIPSLPDAVRPAGAMPFPLLAVVSLSLTAVVWLLASLVNDWRLDHHLARLGMRRWRRAAFAYRYMPAGLMRWMAGRLDDGSLLGAWHLPEHTSAAKAVIAEELGRRGHSAEAVAGWLLPAAQTHVRPSVSHALPVERYQAMVVRRRRLFGWFRWLAALILLTYGVFLAIGDHRETEEQAKERQAREQQQAERRASPPGKALPSAKPAAPAPSPPAASAAPPAVPAAKKDDRPIEMISPDSRLNPKNLPPQYAFVGRILEIVIGVVFPISLIAFFLVGGITTWLDRHRALRVLLLRPFGQARMTRAVRRLVLDHLGPRALVYTLEDRDYRENWLFWAVAKIFSFFKFVLGPLLRPPLRIASVDSERAYVKLGLKLAGQWGPSFRSFVTGGQAFAIRSTNAWWKTVIDLLMNSSDIIVMDVSRVSTGSAWEIDRLEARGLLPRCIFVVQKGYEGDGMEGVRRLLPSTLVPELFTYDQDGRFAERAAFEAALSDHVRTALAAWGGPQHT